MSISTQFRGATQLEVLKTGIGLSDKGVPLRLPALIVPGLKYLQEMLDQGNQSRYIIYQATDFIITTNRLDVDKARQNSFRITSYLQSFVERFFPGLTDHVEVLAGENCVVQESDLQFVESIFDEASDTDALDLISEYGQNHLGDFRRYAAANVLLNGGCFGRYPLKAQDLTDKTTVTLVGGAKEEPFFKLTSNIARATGCAHVTQARIVDVGKMPTYYPCRDGDLLIDDDSQTFKPPRRIRNDFQLLASVGGSISALRDVARSCSPAISI